MHSNAVSFRLTDDDIAVLDALVESGQATDRTAALRRALSKERHRQMAEQDALIYLAEREAGVTDPDRDELDAWIAR